MRREAIIILVVISVFLALGCTGNDSTEQPVDENDTNKSNSPPEPITENDSGNLIVPPEVTSVNITIVLPKENDLVSKRSFVEGTSSGIYGSNLNLYVLVYPEGDYWWVQETDIDSNGNWESNAYFGDPTKPSESIGTKFRIVVIATSIQLEAGEKFDNVPENVYRADIKEVIRK